MGLNESTVVKPTQQQPPLNSPGQKSKSNLAAVQYLLDLYRQQNNGLGPHAHPAIKSSAPANSKSSQQSHHHHQHKNKDKTKRGLSRGLTETDIRNSNTLLPSNYHGLVDRDNYHLQHHKRHRSVTAPSDISTQTQPDLLQHHGNKKPPKSLLPTSISEPLSLKNQETYHPEAQLSDSENYHMLGGEFTGKVLMLSGTSCVFQKIRRNPKDKRKRNFSVPEVTNSNISECDSALSTLHTTLHTDCNLTCHKGCQDAVTLDCESLDLRSPSDADVPHPDLTQDYQIDFEEVTLALHNTYPKDNTINTDVDTTYGSEDSGLFLEETLHAQIKAYNFHATPGFQMAFVPESEGSLFRGFIRVHMNLTRPINVVAGTRPPSIYDILKEDDTLEKKTLTTFYLPRDTVRALHITSETTTQEVIRVLLKKFKVVDNPRKFALYERYYDHGETTKVKMRRIADNEKPLVLALLWGCEKNCNKRFVLQENDTGDILWEAFSLPELSNFLRILDREEEEYKRQVQQKYKLMEMRIRDAMERIRPPTIEIISPIITCNVLKIELEPSSNLTESET